MGYQPPSGLTIGYQPPSWIQQLTIHPPTQPHHPPFRTSRSLPAFRVHAFTARPAPVRRKASTRRRPRSGAKATERRLHRGAEDGLGDDFGGGYFDAIFGGWLF